MKFNQLMGCNAFWLQCAVVLLPLLPTAQAADAPVAVVNGVAIASGLLDRTVQANVAQGQKDSAELRAALKQEFIAREVMTQEAQKRGLEKLASTQDALLSMRQNLLIDLLMQDEFTKQPITDAELKAEYDRQVKVLKAGGDLQQFQISNIVVASVAAAQDILAALRQGQAFDALAKSKSLDPSKDNGGDLGWLLPDQMTPAISNVVVNLASGAVSAAPIQVGPYWHVVKVTGKRPYQVPGYEEIKNLMQNAVIQARRTALLKKLTDAAVVK